MCQIILPDSVYTVVGNFQTNPNWTQQVKAINVALHYGYVIKQSFVMIDFHRTVFVVCRPL